MHQNFAVKLSILCQRKHAFQIHADASAVVSAKGLQMQEGYEFRKKFAETLCSQTKKNNHSVGLYRRMRCHGYGQYDQGHITFRCARSLMDSVIALLSHICAVHVNQNFAIVLVKS